ncbi:DUF1501 domain-containing protein [Schlesneria sp.]|uniref:DUF1501 domain-containing protein n=1 Tax=Schlesneria sp. TaxID=2762018 RepID=UPI002EE72107
MSPISSTRRTDELDRLTSDRLRRRAFLSRSGLGIGSVALSSLLSVPTARANPSPQRERFPGLPGLPHLPPKIKRVIFLCMAGGPSHLETFDYKPQLAALHGQPMPESFTKGQPIAQLQNAQLQAHGPMFKFGQYGGGGQWISEVLPWHQKMADDICIINSMTTEQINHDPAHTFMNCGTAISGRPSMGAWINYGLGSETSDLPGFVVLTSVGGRLSCQPIASRQWSSGFLPSRFQGVEFASSGEPVHYVQNPPGISARLQRASVDTIQQIDRLADPLFENDEIDARVSAFETAFRMQTAVPELIDTRDEPSHVFELYGATPGDGSFGSNCILARRLAERGVRFIHLYHRGWDHHGDLQRDIVECARHTDRASYALITDLKQRGMLDETLVVWGGEFGRTPMVQNKGKTAGRDHHIKGFSIWLAGGGIRTGGSYGATDELGYHAVEKPVHVRDLHATMLHLLGIDHSQFSYRFQGLDLKLTGVEEAHILREILG